MERDEGVYFIADPSYHGWTHEGTSQTWDYPQDAARDFIAWCDKRDAELAQGLANAVKRIAS